ncbi:hypothetical protein KNE206_06920 [Kitasatospora sp. NE20-6]
MGDHAGVRAAEGTGPDTACRPVKQPQARPVPGSYPQSSCVRHAPDTGEYTVSPAGFARHT